VKKRKAARTHVISEYILLGTDFNGIGDEAEDSTDPEEHGEASEEVLAKFHPFGSRLGRRQSVGSVPLQIGFGLR
jgi:hypothetical protein